MVQEGNPADPENIIEAEVELPSEVEVTNKSIEPPSGPDSFPSSSGSRTASSAWETAVLQLFSASVFNVTEANVSEWKTSSQTPASGSSGTEW